MKPGTKFAIGALVIVGSVSLMISEGIKTTGTYFFTPTQLVERVEKDSTLHDVGLKVSAKVVRGTIKRNSTTQQVDFTISDGTHTFPVVYVGLVPDTFTDDTEIDVVVEGKFGRDQVFHATDVIAKCGSRYEAVLKEPTKKA